jgi:IS30 family transposase
MNRYTYRASRSDRRARRNAAKRRGGKHKIGLNQRLWDYIYGKLKLRWSPEQIAQSLRREYPDDQSMRISHEAIYTYLYVLPRGELKQRLLSMLRRERKRRRKRGAKGAISKELEDMLSIEERPAEVADRIVPGHWEGDLLIGRNRQSALGSLVERKTRFVILAPLRNKTAQEVRKAFAREMKSLPAQLKRSLTYDQGREMAQHKLFTRDTRIQVYFAHPASPWERGTNENMNGLIRQFFPKGTDFNKVSRREIKKVQKMLNGRPRKILNWEKPCDVYQQVLR